MWDNETCGPSPHWEKNKTGNTRIQIVNEQRTQKTIHKKEAQVDNTSKKLKCISNQKIVLIF